MIADLVAALVLAVTPVTETRLTARPSVVAPGDVVSLTLENAESRALRYGLPFRVQRRAGGQWRHVALRDVAIPHFGFRLPLLRVRPGERAGPLTSPVGLLDGLPLAGDVPPGRYRIVRDVKVQDGPRLRLTAPFTVRRDSARDPRFEHRLPGRLIPSPPPRPPRSLLPTPGPLGDAFGTDLIGLPVREAQLRAAAHGFELRAISIDREGQLLNRDYRRDRLNVVVHNGHVTRFDGAY